MGTVTADFGGPDPSDPDPYYNLGQLYQETEQFDLAIETYEAALFLDDSDPEAYYRLGQMYQKQGNHLTMQRYLDLFIEKAANLPQFQDEIENAKRMKRGTTSDD